MPSVSYLCCSVSQSCLTLCNSMDCSTPGLPVPHHLPEFAQVHVHCINDVIQPSHPLMPSFFLPLIFPSIKDFSNELALHINWPKYWSFSFSISLSNEYSGLISLKIDWFVYWFVADKIQCLFFRPYCLQLCLIAIGNKTTIIIDSNNKMTTK